MPRKRTKIICAVAAAAIIAGGVGWTLISGGNANETSAASQPAVETDTARTTDLIERVETKGTLSHGKATSYGTQLSGTITSIASPGTTLTVGSEMMRVNERPVFTMHGNIPAWRNFEEGMSDGQDVQQLEQNLAKLGYFTDEPDKHFGWATASAIAEWNEDHGFKWSTTLELGRVVFAPGDVQVSALKANPGDAASTEALEATTTSKVVTAEVEPSLRSLLPVGAKTNIKLPNGKTTQGVVEAVDPPVEKEDKSGRTTVKVPVRFSLADPEAAKDYTDVTVGIETQRTIAKQVLAVPVQALLAEPSGGHAVEVVKDGTTKRVPVEVGAFADSMVEIKGGDLHEGDTVTVSQ